MKLFENFIAPWQNCEEIIYELSKALNFKVTMTSIQRDLQEHPNYPSIFSISQVLTNYNVSSLAFHLNLEDFHKIPTPFVVNLIGGKSNKNLFGIIQKIEGDLIRYYDPDTKKIETKSMQEFRNIYQGVVLAVQPSGNAGEKDYVAKRKIERQKGTIQTFCLLGVPIIIFCTCILSLVEFGTKLISPIIFTLVSLAGFITTLLLLLFEFDENNVVLKKICYPKRQVNCSSILNSNASRIFGVNWSLLGASFFMGNLIALLTGGIVNFNILFLLSWINIMTLPYILFSITYQYFVAKQWCVLCLIVQGVLLLQFLTALSGGFQYASKFDNLNFQTFITIITSFIIALTFFFQLVPLIKQVKQGRARNNELLRLKNDPRTLQALLLNQKYIGTSAEGLGIFVGNPDAKFKLTKVCNPYCSHCATAHSEINYLLENNEDLQVQIIFNSDDNGDDFSSLPTRHLMAIALHENEEQVKKALDDWYLAEIKDYKKFAVKYPIDEYKDVERDKLRSMKDWCKRTEIAYTPTLFVNGYQMPEMYSIADLRYFFAD